jgi:hypothetical protein
MSEQKIVTYREPALMVKTIRNLKTVFSEWKTRFSRWCYKRIHDEYYGKTRAEWFYTTPKKNNKGLWQIEITDKSSCWPWEEPEKTYIMVYSEDGKVWRTKSGDLYELEYEFRIKFLREAVEKILFNKKYKLE